MKNVYEAVRVFFEEDSLPEPSIIDREWIEGFLRQQAWSGSTDQELRQIWEQLKALQIYLSCTYHQSLDEVEADDYADAIRWLGLHVESFKVNLKNARYFLAVLDSFYQYLFSRKLISDYPELRAATARIVGGKRLNLTLQYDDLHGVDIGAANPYASIFAGAGDTAATLGKIMMKLGSYFQHKDHDEDFHRALYLYIGPFRAMPPLDVDSFSDFWIGFWDYFLFDYHMRQDDLSPVKHYLRSKNRLTSVEKALLKQISEARYVVFYIQRIIDSEWVECVDLFTEEQFRLPYPGFDNKAMKRLLFFGHIFGQGVFTTNYITSVEVSAILRQRIKQEALRLKTLFTVQQPNATWADFLARHSLAIRHTIILLTTFAKLNVTADTDFSDLPAVQPVDDTRKPDPQVLQQLKELMPNYGFSIHDIVLAESMWRDFSQVSDVKIRKSGAWTAAVISCYAMVNSPLAVTVEKLAEDCGVSAATIYTNRRRIASGLALRRHDPRYLSEEGIILLLYSS